MPFELSRTSVRLAALNTRRELHGEDPQPAADLKIELRASNDTLAMFHPTLKHSLYDKPQTKELIDDPHHMPTLRYPKLGALKYDEEIVGATVTIKYGVKSEIVLNTATVNDFRLEPQDGGTVVIGFRIQAHPDEKSAGKLYTMIGTDIDITVEPPEADESNDNEK